MTYDEPRSRQSVSSGIVLASGTLEECGSLELAGIGERVGGFARRKCKRSEARLGLMDVNLARYRERWAAASLERKGRFGLTSHSSLQRGTLTPQIQVHVTPNRTKRPRVIPKDFRRISASPMAMLHALHSASLASDFSMHAP